MIVDWESDSDKSSPDLERSTTPQQESILFRNLDGVDIRDGIESDDEFDVPSDLWFVAILLDLVLLSTSLGNNNSNRNSHDATGGAIVGDEVEEKDEDDKKASRDSTTPTQDEYFDCSQSNSVPVDDFHLAVMVLATACDLSHNQYRALREILQLATLESIASLPETLPTLRERVRRNMPLLKLRGHDLKTDLTKIPPKSNNPKKAYCFEMQDYAERWLLDNQIRQSMHFGLGIIGKSRQEFWHGDAWLGSIRTTSGDFAYIGDAPLLPSDCVSYFPTVHGLTSMTPSYLRIHGVGRLETSNGEPAVIAKRLLALRELNQLWSVDLVQTQMDLESEVEEVYPYFHADLPELVLLDSDRLVIPVSALAKHESIRLLDTSPDDTARILSGPPSHCVRYIAYCHNGIPTLRRIHQRHRIPAEQELLDFGREQALKQFVIGEERRVSIPVTIFIDGFGLYRNSYKSLQGVYLQPACLDEPGRFTLQNMWVLTIGPFGTDTSQIAKCFEKEGNGLGGGIKLKNGDILIMFPLCITGDMPQQNHNAGIMSHLSRRGCRYCRIRSEDKGNLEYDIHRNGRYRQPHDNLVTHILSQNLSASARAAGFAKHGISSNGHIFQTAFPSLDCFSAYPSDPMHVEFRLAKYFHECLIKDVFSKAGTDAYEAAWNQINVPYGW